MSFVKRLINFQIRLGSGTFGEGTGNTVTLSGLRASVTIAKAGRPGLDHAEARVYGMPLSLMNQISTLGKPPLKYVRDNMLTIIAGDATNGMATVYIGTLQEAWTDFTGMPEVGMNMQGWGGLFDAMRPVPPTTFSGSADVATIMSGFAAQMDFAFVNSGVTGVLANPYFYGSLRKQIDDCCKAANIERSFDNATLTIWPRGQAKNSQIPLISPATGLVGYPQYTGASGIAFRTLYNPSISFGGQVKIDSSLKPAAGTWIVTSVIHDLSTEDPGGPWFTDVTGFALGNPELLPP